MGVSMKFCDDYFQNILIIAQIATSLRKKALSPSERGWGEA